MHSKGSKSLRELNGVQNLVLTHTPSITLKVLTSLKRGRGDGNSCHRIGDAERWNPRQVRTREGKSAGKVLSAIT